ncbi:hypothetical protein ISF6_5361 [Piscinibacter sakaiensis]|uniref:Uncharacterized protein n=1 Tax=Piscinibacter sakaiensis TaxID=1547922 RepID=A0A0K8P824_PISS1|nr:hypothetical protein ISF6_5361 [Piscinibacter sakaiensis]
MAAGAGAGANDAASVLAAGSQDEGRAAAGGAVGGSMPDGVAVA